MDWLSRIDLSLLAIMFANTAVVTGDCLRRYGKARRQSRAFVRDAAPRLSQGDWAEVISIAERNSASPAARTVVAGLSAFAGAAVQCNHREAMEFAARAFERSRSMLTAELRLGLGTLASIGGSAPFIGLLGTVFGMFNAFLGVGMEKSTALAWTALGVAHALGTTAFGLFVAIPAVCWHNYFRECVEGFETEMSNAKLETTTYLRQLRERRHLGNGLQIAGASWTSRPSDIAGEKNWEAPYDRQHGLLLAVWLALAFTALLIAQGGG